MDATFLHVERSYKVHRRTRLCFRSEEEYWERHFSLISTSSSWLLYWNIEKLLYWNIEKTYYNGILRRLTIMIKSASSVVLFKRATTAYHVEEFKQLMGWIHLISTRCVSYLERASFTYWSIVHFVEDRHNIITNNNVESLNSMLRHTLSLLITCLVEQIRSTMQKLFYECRTISNGYKTV